MKKKLISIIMLSMLLLLSFSSMAFADSNQITSSENLMNQYSFLETCADNGMDVKIIDISAIPENVTPLEFDTWEEAFAAMNSDNNAAAEIAEDTQQYTYRSVPSKTKLFNSVSITLYSNISGSGALATFSTFRSLNSTCNLYGNSWTQTDYEYSYTDGHRTMEGVLYGLMEHYIIVGGIGTVWTESRAIDFYFYASELS